jgi:APA family basic amino acid/polyamine antiporter
MNRPIETGSPGKGTPGPGSAGIVPTLDRRLRPVDAAAVVVSNVIGSGILFLPAIVAGIAPNPWALLGVWAAGGLLAFAGAMAYAELAAMRPRSGGEYVYLREAFGPLPAFLTGWTSFVAGFSGAIAASAVGLAAFLGRFLPAAGDTTPWFTLPLGPVALSLSSQSLVALITIAALSIVHARGLGPGRVVQNALAVFKVLALLVFVAFGLTIGRGDMAHFAEGGTVAASGLLLALVPVMFSYSGWNAASYIAEEIENPGRNIPRALALGTVVVVLVYLAMIVVYVYAIPVSELRQLNLRVVDAAADRLFGPAAGDALTIVTLVIAAGSISAMIFAGPRVYYAMARDGLFFPQAARVHRRWHTPAFAIAAQGIWSGLLVLSGRFDQLVNYTGFAVVLFAGIAVTSLFVLRRKYPHEPRPFRAWGYPVAPAVFAITSFLMVVNAIWREPGPSLAGVVIIGLGVPLFFMVNAIRSQRSAVGGQSHGQHG